MGADESLRCSDPDYDDRVKAITLHHTAGGNRYGPEEPVGIVRGTYAHHARTLGWCDIATTRPGGDRSAVAGALRS